ncbi:MAG: hypothetical protein ABIG34_03235 [Candidatus Peregrinibacteria bacterium]
MTKEVEIAIPKENPRQPHESELEYQDRMDLLAFGKLHELKKRTVQQEKEYKVLLDKVTATILLKEGHLPEHFADNDLKKMVVRIHTELVNSHGIETPLKRILIDRLASVWSMAYSYERAFGMTKYNKNEDGGYSAYYSKERTAFLKETRRGIESANDQILRLTQALQNLVSPPIQIMAKNAIVAQNMQINQGVVSKDFDKKTSVSDNPENHAKTTH